MEKHIQAPLLEAEIRDLKAGDYVYITGTLYTARDAAHKRMQEALDRGEGLPFDIKDQVIYYMGPSPAREGRPIGSAGPTHGQPYGQICTAASGSWIERNGGKRKENKGSSRCGHKERRHIFCGRWGCGSPSVQKGYGRRKLLPMRIWEQKLCGSWKWKIFR